MRVLVLGAGVVGVAAAWYLAADGHEVSVVDRQPGPALETSYANGGQISVSHAEPWAGPGVFGQVIRWLGREESPLLWRLRLDPAQWAWGLRFLGECSVARNRANVEAIVRLGLASRARLQALRRELQFDYGCLERGILHVYTDARDFDKTLPQAERMREFGCERVLKSAAECLAIEPALAGATVPIVGGTYTAGDESGDARRFTEGLAAACAARGVGFRFGAAVAGVEREGDRMACVRLADGTRLTADAYVVALGSYSPRVLAPLGIRIPVYPAKGYSATLPLAEGALAPTVSLTDDRYKLVFSRLGQSLRVAGTAEFAGYDTALNERRCRVLMKRVGQLFPALADTPGVEYWTGLRPATPGNVPLVGPTRYSNLWLDTGHGTLGWTLACGSGQLLADLVAGRDPGLDAGPYRPG